MKLTLTRIGYVLMTVGALMFFTKAEANSGLHGSARHMLQPNINQMQTQGQLQGQAQKQTNKQQSINKQSLSTVVQHNEKRRPVNSAYAPSMYSANECMGSTSVGGQGLRIGLTFGTTWTDDECALFKAASDFEQAGYKDDALVIRCKSKFAKDTPSCSAIRGE